MNSQDRGSKDKTVETGHLGQERARTDWPGLPRQDSYDRTTRIRQPETSGEKRQPAAKTGQTGQGKQNRTG